MKTNHTINGLLSHRAAVLHRHGRTEQFNELAKQMESDGANELNAIGFRERKDTHRKNCNQIMKCNEQLIDDLIESYLTTESKEWKEEVETRLSGILEILEGVSDLLEVEVECEGYNLSRSAEMVEKCSKKMRNFNDEYYIILRDANSRNHEDRKDSISQREQVEALMMRIRATGI